MKQTLPKLALTALLIVAACSSGDTITGGDPDDQPPVPEPGAPPIPEGNGYFTFTGSPGSKDRPVRVYYYRPPGLTANSRIVFAMHGNGRNATGMRNTWRPYATSRKFLLIVPEFTEDLYPSSMYHRGNIMGSGNTPNDSTLWTYVTIEKLFDEVKRRTGIKRDKYTIYGHSAGSQFVHRMLQMMPGARIEQAVAANAGWYTIPTGDVDWPYGLRGIPSSMDLNDRLEEVFGRDVIILLGTADTSTTDPDLSKTAQAMAQGKHRLERGHYFYNTSKNIAASRSLPFNWQLVTVPEVGHSNSGMAPAAVKAMSW